MEPKSIIISRKKVVKDVSYACILSSFRINNPHLSGEEPLDIQEFEDKHKVVIKGPKEINYLLFGSDIVINDIKKLDLKSDKEHVYINIEQE